MANFNFMLFCPMKYSHGTQSWGDVLCESNEINRQHVTMVIETKRDELKREIKRKRERE